MSGSPYCLTRDNRFRRFPHRDYIPLRAAWSEMIRKVEHLASAAFSSNSFTPASVTPEPFRFRCRRHLKPANSCKPASVNLVSRRFKR